MIGGLPLDVGDVAGINVQHIIIEGECLSKFQTLIYLKVSERVRKWRWVLVQE